jgi:hypothetical protein
MSIDFQPLGPDTSNQYNKLWEEIRKQKSTIDETLSTKAVKREDINTKEERNNWVADKDALPTKSLLELVAELLFGNGEERPGLYVNQKVEGDLVPEGKVKETF